MPDFCSEYFRAGARIALHSVPEKLMVVMQYSILFMKQLLYVYRAVFLSHLLDLIWSANIIAASLGKETAPVGCRPLPKIRQGFFVLARLLIFLGFLCFRVCLSR
jgi:hypothetical protein